MSGAQKISLSLLISVIVFSALAVLAAVDRFQVIETRFYIPRVEESVTMRAEAARDVFDRFHRANIARFEEFTLEPAVRAAFRINASAAEIRERRNRLDTIEQERASLDLVRIIDVAATQLHYSSNPDDFAESGTQRTYDRPDVVSTGEPRSLASLAYYEEFPEAQALPSGAALPEPEIFLEPESNQFIYRLPAVDTTGVLQGAALFYVNTSDLSTALIRAGLIGTGDVVRLINGGGVVANAPTQFSAGLAEAIDRTWAEIADLDGRETVTTERAEEADRADELAVSYEAFPVQSESDGVLVFLEPSSSLQMPELLQYTLLVAVFLTTFLIVFLLLNVRQDAIVVISDRVKRFQINLLREYMENRRELDFRRWQAELEDRRDEVQREIRRGLGRIKPSQQEEVDRLINESWDEIISVLSSRAEERPTVSLDVERIEEIVDQLSRRLEQSGVGHAPPAAFPPAEPAPAVQGGPSTRSPGTPVEVEDIADDEEPEEIEEIEAAEELEEPEEIEEVEAAETAEAAGSPVPPMRTAGGASGTPVEVEEIDEEAEVEELEAAEELESAEELAGSEDVLEAESPDESDELEEAGELEEVEQVDELEEAGELEQADELEEVPSVADEADASEPERHEPGPGVPVDVEPEVSLEQPSVESPESEEEGELAGGQPAIAADETPQGAEGRRDVVAAPPELPADVSLENLDEAAELEWLARAESADLPGPVFAGERDDYEPPGLDEGSVADGGESPASEQTIDRDGGEALPVEDAEPVEELEELESEGAEDTEPVEEAEAVEEPDEPEELEEIESGDADEAEPLEELGAVEEADTAEYLEPVEEPARASAAEEELEELEPEEIDGEPAAPEELPAAPAGSTTFGSGFFSFGRGVEVRLPDRESEAAELESEPWGSATESPAGEGPDELEEIAGGEELEDLASPGPVGSAQRESRGADGLIRFEPGREGPGDGYESASLSTVLDRLHIDRQVLVENEGVVEIDRSAYGEGPTGHDEQMRLLVESVVGDQQADEGSGIESLFGGGTDDLLSALQNADDDQRRERRASQLSLFRFGEQGFDYDGFLRGYQDNEGGVLKSLVRFTRVWNARVGVLLVEDEHGLVPTYQLGLDPTCANSLGITKSSGLYRHLLARRNVVFIEQPITDVEYFHDLCSPESLALFDRTLVLPIVFHGANAYALLGLPRSVESLDDAFRAVVPHLSQAQGVLS